jgi:hypothetical protein
MTSLPLPLVGNGFSANPFRKSKSISPANWRLRNIWPNKRQDAASEPNDEAKLLDDVEKYGCYLVRNVC